MVGSEPTERSVPRRVSKAELIAAIHAFLSFFDKAEGESTQKGKEKWVETFSWDIPAGTASPSA